MLAVLADDVARVPDSPSNKGAKKRGPEQDFFRKH